MHQEISGRDPIPDIVVRRLPIYARGLRHLLNNGRVTVSSSDLAHAIGVTAAQIRRDLSYFGRFGKQGKGYDVPTLIEAVQQILKIDRQWDVALVGFGHLGQAIADYHGFEPSSFRIAAIFDRANALVGSHSAHGIIVETETEIASRVRALNIRMGIVAVPADQAQEVTEHLIHGGVRGILNYAPVTLRVPDGVWVREIDPISLMQSMTYYLADESEARDDLGEVQEVAYGDAAGH